LLINLRAPPLSPCAHSSERGGDIVRKREMAEMQFQEIAARPTTFSSLLGDLYETWDSWPDFGWTLEKIEQDIK
jgi:hypothetical protein